MPDSPPRLLDQFREKIRLKHYGIRTEHAYVYWAKRFVLYHGRRHPRDLGPGEVGAFLTHLAVVDKVAASTQNQAKSALLFSYEEALGTLLPWRDDITQTKASRRLPVVLTVDEVSGLLDRTSGTCGLIPRLLYGTGMRVMKCLRLRVKDAHFVRRDIVVRKGKGSKNRVTMLPARRVAPACGVATPPSSSTSVPI